MALELTRRDAIVLAATLLSSVATRGLMAKDRRPADLIKALRGRLAMLEKTSGGRFGVTVLDSASGERADLHSDDRFPMCSTFKFLAAAAVLARVDRKEEQLDRRIRFTRADLLEYAPVTTARVGEGSMTVGDLCSAAVTVSDNTAANLLLATMGGPAGLTTYIRSIGDTVTQLDRTEPTLNEATPGDLRDTTTPSAMVGNMKALLLGEVLSPDSRTLLTTWLVGCTTGKMRLRAGLPATWQVGDKTGSGNHGTTNDIAILWPPGYAPILLTAYLTNTSATLEAREASLAGITKALTGT